MRMNQNINADDDSIASLFSHVIGGERSSLARALTLVESQKVSDKQRARKLMNMAWQHRLHKQNQSIRVGFVGSPGAGKSSLIGAIGKYFHQEGKKKVAVLCVDPSSPLSGGSILGDRLRMAHFAGSAGVFVRGMSSRGDEGGLSASLCHASMICEAAGYDFILIETGGVGQSQVAIRELVHCLVMVVPPAGGDDIQAMKRGLLEIVDMIAVSKFDGVFQSSVNRTFSDLQISARMSGRGQAIVRTSIIAKEGLADLIESLNVFFSKLDRSTIEQQQWQRWMDREFLQMLTQSVMEREDFAAYYEKLKDEVFSGKLYAGEAAHLALENLWHEQS